MNLELAIVQSCNETGCTVRPLQQPEVPLTVRYAAAVQGRIRIRRDQLVAVDLEPAVPELVWRWRQAEVLQPLRELPAHHHVVAACGLALEAPLAQPGLQLEPGDAVWIAGTAGGGKEIVDRVLDGGTAHPDWIRRHYFPLIEAEYAALDAAG